MFRIYIFIENQKSNYDYLETALWKFCQLGDFVNILSLLRCLIYETKRPHCPGYFWLTAKKSPNLSNSGRSCELMLEKGIGGEEKAIEIANRRASLHCGISPPSSLPHPAAPVVQIRCCAGWPDRKRSPPPRLRSLCKRRRREKERGESYF